MNLVLAEAKERVIRPVEEEQDSEEVPLGTYIIRGDNVAVCGRVKEDLDESIDWEKVHGDAVPEMPRGTVV
jgi:U6 snRNA-associated Sm-like protein LSm8